MIVENNGRTTLTAFLSGVSGVDVVIDLEYTGDATLDADFTAPAQIIIQRGRGGDLHHLLIAALGGAFTFTQV